MIRMNVVDEISKLKQRAGGNIPLAGSASLVQTVIKHDLVDEAYLWIYPVVLGSGKRLFQDGCSATLKEVESRIFGPGGIALIYEPDGKSMPGHPGIEGSRYK